MISFDKHGTRFNHRVAGACLHENHVLLQTTASANFHILPGGRIEMNEDSRSALEREMCEEIECETKIERLVWTVENFFTLDGETYHEVSFIYEFKPKNETILDPKWKRTTTDAGIEIHFAWHPLEALGEANVKPSFLRESLKKLPETTEHIVVREQS